MSSSSGESWSTDYSNENVEFNRVAPAWPDPPALSAGGWSSPTSVIDQTWQLGDAAALGSFRAVRVEVWRGAQFPGTPTWVDDFVPAPGYSTPFESQPAVVKGGSFRASFDMSHVRETHWVVFVTGVAGDGIRYRLQMPMAMRTSFSGTVWDWLTARG
jgi:hypothetical protein